MSNLVVTIVISAIFIGLAITALAIGLILTGKSKMIRGSCGLRPSKKKDNEEACDKSSNEGCSTCGRK